MTTEKILDKLAKLKRHADSAKAIGSEAEAQAFADMLQKLLLDHKLSMSDIDFETMEKDSPVETHYINYSQYPDIKLKGTRVAWIEDLAAMVARAHFCRILVHKGSSRITLVGRKEDVTVAEWMFIVLQRAAEKISGRAYDAYRNEERRKAIAEHGEAGRHGSMPHTFGFRESFITGFINRLRERLKETQAAATASSSMALMRLSKSDAAVVDYMAKFTGKAGQLSRNSRYHGEGLSRGRSAADRINLGTRGVDAGAPTKAIR